MVGMLMSGISVGLLFAVITHLVEDESPSRLPLHPKIWALRTGPWPVSRTCSKPVCQEYSQWATCVAEASNVWRPQLAKDRSQFHSFIKYSRNRNQIEPCAQSGFVPSNGARRNAAGNRRATFGRITV